MKMTRILASASAVALVAGLAQAETQLTMLVDAGANATMLEALAAAYTAANPDVTFDIEQRPGGGDGDNIVKTRLATGEMADIFLYNTGSLFQALNPTEVLVPVGDLPNAGAVLPAFNLSVTGTDGQIYGVPAGSSMGGGIMYNIPLYEQLGLSVPMTWDEFIANAQAIQATGVPGVIQTYGATWSSQLFVLGDNFNVMAEIPNFPELYTTNQIKIADTPAAMRAWNYQQQVFDLGLLNEDFGAAIFEDGMEMIATGAGGHYPMLSAGISYVSDNFPENVNDVGFFGVPGPSAESNGLTVWTPAGLYIPKTSEHIDIARDFLNFVATPEACDVITGAIGVTGPYMVAGCTLPADVPRIVQDMQVYFDSPDRTAPALEFVSPIKGPNLEFLLIEVGSGIRPAAEAAALYDQDVEKQAQQLGLPNW
jgi:raffinose/stachyose/melibiose transport system substrate-binding protein